MKKQLTYASFCKINKLINHCYSWVIHHKFLQTSTLYSWFLTLDLSILISIYLSPTLSLPPSLSFSFSLSLPLSVHVTVFNSVYVPPLFLLSPLPPLSLIQSGIKSPDKLIILLYPKVFWISSSVIINFLPTFRLELVSPIWFCHALLKEESR